MNPNFEQVSGTARKHLRIPLPGRKAKRHALGPDRALTLGAEMHFHDDERSAIRKASRAPRLQGSPLASAPRRLATSTVINTEHATHQHQQAFEIAREAMEQSRRREKREVAQRLGAHYHRTRGGHVEASHDELIETHMPHRVPTPGLPCEARLAGSYRAIRGNGPTSNPTTPKL